MEYFVYIIYSEKLDLFYKGYSTAPFHRVEEHNSGLSRYTKDKGPWKLVFLQKCNSKKEALIKEQQLKKVNHTYLKWLLRLTPMRLKRGKLSRPLNPHCI